MSAVCPSHEVDELTISLLNIYESRGSSYVLLEALIKQEIEETGELFSSAIASSRRLELTARQITSPSFSAEHAWPPRC